MEDWRSLALVRDFFRVEFIIVLELQIKVIQLQGSDNIVFPHPLPPKTSSNNPNI